MASIPTLNTHAGVHLLRNKYKAPKRPSGKVTVPDAHILDMRRKHEVDGLTHRQVMEAYPQYSEKYVRAVLNYILRAHLRVS